MSVNALYCAAVALTPGSTLTYTQRGIGVCAPDLQQPARLAFRLIRNNSAYLHNKEHYVPNQFS